MSRVVLILPTATYRAPDFLAAARALDVAVVVASERAPALSSIMGDGAIVVPLDRPEAAARIIVDSPGPFDAVIGVDDQGVLIASLAAEALGLVHNPPAAVTATRNKAVMRRALARAGVAQPRFEVVGPRDDPVAAAQGLGPPVVVKPLSQSGGQGVMRAETAQAAAGAAERVRRILAESGSDPNQPILVEEYVPGSEYALEGLLRAGNLEVLALFDKPDPLEGPYFEETLYVTPSRLEPPRQAEVSALVTAAAEAVGLREGPVHGEVRLAGPDGWVIELAARSIGGLCSRSLRFGAGISLEEVILRHALGCELSSLERADAASGVMMIPIPRSGRLASIDGLDEASAVEGVVSVEITVGPDRPVRALPDGDRYLGFIFARAGSPEAVEAALRAAHGRLSVSITDLSGSE